MACIKVKSLAKPVKLVIILLIIPLICVSCLHEVDTREPMEMSRTAGASLKFMELVCFNERSREASFIVQYSSNFSTEETPGFQNVFLNARTVKFVNDNTATTANIKVTTGCKMVYTLYPFDSHFCSISLRTPAEILFFKDLSTYEFVISGYLAAPSLGLLTGNSSIDNDGPETVIFVMSRTSASQILTEMYTPVILLTLLSFLTMFNLQSYVVRIALSMTLLVASIIITSMFWHDIPRSDDLTVIEHYFAICVGFIFQVAFSNILMHWYTSVALKRLIAEKSANGSSSHEDLEAHKKAVDASTKPGTSPKLKDWEELIHKMGKCQSFIYFKMLKPSKKHIPVWFIIINLIYWSLVIYFSSGLPIGFQRLPTS